MNVLVVGDQNVGKTTLIKTYQTVKGSNFIKSVFGDKREEQEVAVKLFENSSYFSSLNLALRRINGVLILSDCSRGDYS